MTRVLIFGASHVAQVSMAFYGLKSRNLLPADLHVDFLSAPGPIIGRLKVAGPFLTVVEKPATWPDPNLPAKTFDEWYELVRTRVTAISGGDAIDLKTYDAVFFIGGQLLSRWHSIDKAQAAGAYSRGCLEQLCTDIILRSHFFKCLNQEDASVETCKIMSCFEPIQSELLPEYQDFRQDVGHFSQTHDLLRTAAAGLGFAILAFPMELLNEAGNAVSVTYHNGRDGDYGHLNPEGGSYILRSMLQAVPGLGDAKVPLLAFG